MICQVYRSSKKADTYLYLRNPTVPTDDTEADPFAGVPKALLDMLGRLEWVMEIDLDTRAQLAQVDCATLKEQLAASGYFLQLPPAHYQGV